MAQALPLLELGRGSRDTSGGPFGHAPKLLI